MIVQIVEKQMWYLELIKAGCPDKLLSVAFVIMEHINGVKGSDRHGWAYPTREQISELTGKSVNAVSTYTKELADRGWLVKEEVTRQGGRKTFYQLAIGQTFNKKVKEYSATQTAGLMKGRSSVSVDVASPLAVSRSSVDSDLAPSLVTDDKHKLETSTKTETKTLTTEDQRSEGQSPTGTILDSSEGDKVSAFDVMNKAKEILTRYKQEPGSSVDSEVWKCTKHEKPNCYKWECDKEYKESGGPERVGDNW